MTKKFNPSAIGAFVIGAVLLLVLGLLTFGRGNLFEQKVFYQMYFDKSVNGLSVGSAVMFRGIRIGQVTDIRLALKQTVLPEDNAQAVFATDQWPIQVTVKLLPKAFVMAHDANDNNVQKIIHSFDPSESTKELKTWLNTMILKKGLRAQLQTQSLLTGMLFIELDLFDNEAATQEIQNDLANGIIPTRMSAFEKFYSTFDQNDFSNQFAQIHSMLNVLGDFFQSGKANKLLNNLVDSSDNINAAADDVRNIMAILRTYQKDGKGPAPAVIVCEMVSSLNGILSKVEQIIGRLDQKLPGLLDDANASMTTIRETTTRMSPQLSAALEDARRLIGTCEKALTLTEGPSAELVRSLQSAMASVQQLMTTAQITLQNANETLDPHSPVRTDMSKALEEIQKTAQSFRALAELLHQNPEALIRGRQD